MIRYSIVLMLVTLSFFIQAQDRAFHSMTPENLKSALEKCSALDESNTDCKQLKQDATEMSRLAYKLRIDPLGYGQQIIQLQCSIARSKGKSLEQENRSLAEHLQIISWLASPG